VLRGGLERRHENHKPADAKFDVKKARSEAKQLRGVHSSTPPKSTIKDAQTPPRERNAFSANK
jgi:hypothetical protein